MVGKGVRVGAAAFFVGLSLAGPVPLALAEGGEQAQSSAESPAASSSAGVTRSERSPAQRPPRRAARSEAAPELPTRIAQRAQLGEREAPSAASKGPVSVQALLRAAGPNASKPAPASAVRGGKSTAPTTVSAAGLIPSAAAPLSLAPAGAGASAAAVITDPSPAQPSAPVMRTAAPVMRSSAPVMRSFAPGQALASLPGKIAAFLDNVERWLSTLPPNALTEGALLLVRRALGRPLAGGIKGVRVELVNKTDLDLTFGQGPSAELADTKYLLWRLEPGQSVIISHEYDSKKSADVELVIGNNFYQPRMLVQAANHLYDPPSLLLRADPRTDEFSGGKLYNTVYEAMYYDKGWLYNSWERLAEGTGCHCDASNSGGPAQGGMRVYVTRFRDEENYKSFAVAIYELPAVNLTSNVSLGADAPLPHYYCSGNGEYYARDIGRG